MALDPQRLFATPIAEARQAYVDKDVILYALGVGAGSDPALDELRLVYEADLAIMPTMAVVLGYPGFWQKEPQYGIDWPRVLHGEQSVQIHRKLALRGKILTRSTMDRLVDKGLDKGAILYWTRRLYAEDGETLLATVRQSSFLRGDGGCGDWGEGDGIDILSLPDREPDESIALSTRPEQALLYRLSGDYNPLHADPEVARTAGFPTPVLHGLCTYGFAARAIVHLACDGRPERLSRFDVRFSKPVFPGETLRTDVWREADGVHRFRCVVPERGAVVLNNGLAQVIS